MSYANKTYLVTGGAGFIGSNLVHELLKQDAKVIIVDDFNDFYDPKIKELNVKDFEDNDRVSVYRADIREQKALAEIFDTHGNDLKTGGIVHLAARAGVRPSLMEPRLYLETNVTGTLNLIELAKKHQIQKFVFASSSSVYGSSPDQVPFRETQDISKPISPYASTKAMGESLLYTYSHLYGLQVVGLRFFTVYGRGQRPDLAIHKFTKLISNEQTIPVFGDGSTQRDYTYIDDILQGVMAAIAYDKTPYEIFNLGESKTVKLSYLIELIEKAVGKEAKIDRQPLQPGDVPITYADITKSREMLNYQPTTHIEEGIPKFVEWYNAYQSVVKSYATTA